MGAIENLIEHWRGFDLARSPYVHRKDIAALKGVHGLSLDALPYPFVGDVAGADIWFLMLNSNVGDSDKQDEREPYFADQLQRNLRQNWNAGDHPFFSLDPRLKRTGTFQYYNGRCCFGVLIDELSRRTRITSDQARRIVSRRVAVVQYYPYRSRGQFPSGDFADRTPSTLFAKDAVHEAVNAGKLVIIPRSAPKWGFEYGILQPDRLITHRSDQARSPSVKPKSSGGAMAGGDAMLDRLLTALPS